MINKKIIVLLISISFTLSLNAMRRIGPRNTDAAQQLNDLAKERAAMKKEMEAFQAQTSARERSFRTDTDAILARVKAGGTISDQDLKNLDQTIAADKALQDAAFEQTKASLENPPK